MNNIKNLKNKSFSSNIYELNLSAKSKTLFVTKFKISRKQNPKSIPIHPPNSAVNSQNV